jgi:hypothetical protein
MDEIYLLLNVWRLLPTPHPPLASVASVPLLAPSFNFNLIGCCLLHSFFGYLMVIVTPMKVCIAIFHYQSSLVKYFCATLVVC